MTFREEAKPRPTRGSSNSKSSKRYELPTTASDEGEYGQVVYEAPQKIRSIC